MDTSPRCARHPDVETRLRCSACDTPICPACGQDAAVGFKCPDCAAQLEGTTSLRTARGGGVLSRFGGSGSGSGPGGSARRGADRSGRPSAGGGPTGERIPTKLAVRTTTVGLVAAVVGGVVLAPVLQGGAFFLLTSGLIGWGVARAVYWASDGRNSPYVRAIAMTLAGFTVAVALGIAASWSGGRGSQLVFLAYPAAVYGGWIVVRQR